MPELGLGDEGMRTHETVDIRVKCVQCRDTFYVSPGIKVKACPYCNTEGKIV